MTQSDPIDFWFSIGSMYTFLTVMRIDRMEDTTDVRFVWRPFSVRTIMVEMDNRPISKPEEARLHVARPAPARRNVRLRFRRRGALPAEETSTLANYVAVVGAQEGWCADYVRATYRRWFVEKQERGSEPNLSGSLREIGEDPARVIALAQKQDARTPSAAATDEARALGIFGAPTFVARGEVFWGDDRLEDAVTWAQRGTLGAPRAP